LLEVEANSGHSSELRVPVRALPLAPMQERSLAGEGNRQLGVVAGACYLLIYRRFASGDTVNSLESDLGDRFSAPPQLLSGAP
jgi:hypothetical protein